MKTRHTLTPLVAGAAAIMALTLAGCMPFGPQETASPMSSPGDAPTPPTADPNQPIDWGPMAVVPPQGGTDLALAEGILRITETCVVLDSPTGPTLLYWPADRARWVPETRAIRFVNADGTFVTAQDGASIAVGGSGDSVAEGGLPGEDWVNSKPWVVPPDSSCPLERRWGVGYIEMS